MNDTSRQLRNRKNPNSTTMPVGVVGLGLMGTSIAACLMAAGHAVVGVEVDQARRRTVKPHVLALLKEMKRKGQLRPDPSKVAGHLMVTGDYFLLAGSQVVLEAITESVKAKKQVIRKIEKVVSAETLIGSNTSAIPVSILQAGALHPERIFGIHWAEPAHITRFMEIICGKDSLPIHAEKIATLARQWGKEPSLLRRDIRGFITNRCFYALLREAFHLVESGTCTCEDVDRSLRNDLGYWITFAGPFRYLDITGIPAYAAVMKDLFPDLSCETRVPETIQKLVDSGARGISNARGFYDYTPEEAEGWEKRFLKFSYEIRALALKYSEASDRKRNERRKRT